ncbi:hypothetical protein V8F06_011710 [Rhypophila decipiens]
MSSPQDNKNTGAGTEPDQSHTEQESLPIQSITWGPHPPRVRRRRPIGPPTETRVQRNRANCKVWVRSLIADLNDPTKLSLDRDLLEAYSRDRTQQGADPRLQDSSYRSNTAASAGSVGRSSGQSTNAARVNNLSTAPTGLLSPFPGQSNQQASTSQVRNQSTTPTGFLSPFPGQYNQQAGTSRQNNQSTTPTGSISPLPGRSNQPAANSRTNTLSTTPTVPVNPSSGRLEPNTNNQTVITPRQNINTPDLRTPPFHNFSRSSRRPVQEEQISPTPPPLSSRERRTRPGGSGGSGSRVQLTPSRTLRANDAAPSSNWQRPVQQGGENNMMDVDEQEDEEEKMDRD